MRFIVTVTAAAVLIAIGTPGEAETWNTGCVARGTLSQLKEASSKPLRPCKSGETQTTVVTEVKGVQLGRREALLTELGTSKLLLAQRAVNVRLEWRPDHSFPEIVLCKFLFQGPGRTTDGGVGAGRGEDAGSGAGRSSLTFVHDGQAIQIYDTVITIDAAGCFASFRFKEASAAPGQGSMAAVRALYSQ